MKTFEEIAQKALRLERLSDGILCPIPEDCRKLFNSSENGWLRACCQWLEQGSHQVPEEVYPDIENIQDSNHPKRQEVAHLLLLCTKIAICARRICQDVNGDRKELVHHLCKAAWKALTTQDAELTAIQEQMKEIDQKATADSPESIVHKMLSKIADSVTPLTREQAPSTWHLRKVGWLYDLIVLLLGNSQKRPKIRETRVPFVLVSENIDLENEKSFIAEFEFDVLPNGRGEVFITPEQSFVEFKKGFDDLFDVSLAAARRTVTDEEDTDTNPDIRVRINRIETAIGKRSRQEIDLERRLLDNDVLEGRSATATGAIGYYHALSGKVYDHRVIVLAEVDARGNLGPVDQIDTKIRRVVSSGLFDTAVVADGNEGQAKKELSENDIVQLLAVSELKKLAGVRSVLTKEVLSYLRDVATEFGKLPEYFPEHLRDSSPDSSPFDRIRQTVQVVEDRSGLDKWLAEERERQRRSGVDPDAMAYSPRRGLPVDGSGDGYQTASAHTTSWNERIGSRFLRATILGDPGFGKTWLLRYEARRLALKAVDMLTAKIGDLDDIDLPVFLRLSALANRKGALEDDVVRLRGYKLCTGHKLSERFREYLRRQLTSSHGNLLLDAWDEISDLQHRRCLRDRIQAFARQYPTRILLTSRLVGYRLTQPPLPDSKQLELLALNPKQVEVFVKVWFRSDQQKASQFVNQLKQHPQFRGLARIPLMLGLLCEACPQGDFPERRGDLYNRCLRGLLRDWHRSDTRRKYTRKLLSTAYVEELLDALAYASLDLFQRDRQQFRTSELCQSLDAWLDYLHESKPRHQFVKDNTTAIELMERFQDAGIVISATSGDDGELLFLHLTFQEYLAARALAKRVDSIKFAIQHAYVPSWDQVLVMLGGMIERPGPYIAAWLRKNKEDLLCRPFVMAIQAATEAGRDRLPEELFLKMADESAKICLDDLLVSLTYVAERGIRYLPEAIGPVSTAIKAGRIHEGIDALVYIGSDKVVQLLKEATTHKDLEVAATAMFALAEIGSDQAVQAVALALRDEDVSTRLTAMMLLGNVGSEQAGIQIAQTLRTEDDWFARKFGVHILGEIGFSQAVPLLEQALDDKDVPLVRREAILALYKIVPDRVVRKLIRGLKHKKATVRASSAEALGEIGCEKAIPALLQSLLDMKSGIRSEAAEALGRIGYGRSVPSLEQALQAKDSEVRSQAAELLGKIRSVQAIPALTRALEDEGSEVRESVAEALSQIGSKKTAPALLRALQDRSSGVSEKAAKALGRMGFEQAIPILGKMLRYGICWDRSDVAEALGKIGSHQAVAVLSRSARDEDNTVRSSVVRALGETGSEKAIPALAKALQDRESGIRKEAVEALGKIGTKRAIQLLIRALRSSDSEVRQKAVEALSKMGPEKEFLAAKSILKNKDPKVRQIAINALGDTGSTKAVPALVRSLRDKDRYVRILACSALRTILSRTTSAHVVPVTIKEVRDDLRSLADRLDLLASLCEKSGV